MPVSIQVARCQAPRGPGYLEGRSGPVREVLEGAIAQVAVKDRQLAVGFADRRFVDLRVDMAVG